MTSAGVGVTYWFIIGAVLVIALSYMLWRRGLRLYGAIGVIVAIMMLLFGYWSDTEQTGTSEPLDIRITPTLPALVTGDDRSD